MCASVQLLHRKHQRHGARYQLSRTTQGTSGGRNRNRRRKKIETRQGRCTPGQAGNDYIVRERGAKRLQLRLLLEDPGQVSLRCLVDFLSSNDRSFLFAKPQTRTYISRLVGSLARQRDRLKELWHALRGLSNKFTKLRRP